MSDAHYEMVRPEDFARTFVYEANRATGAAHLHYGPDAEMGEQF